MASGSGASRKPWAGWTTLVGLGFLGIALGLTGYNALGMIVFCVSLVGWLWHAFERAGHSWRTWQEVLGGCAGAWMVIGFATFAFGPWAGTRAAGVAAVAGTQVLLAVLALPEPGRVARAGRVVVPIVGHAAGLVGIYTVYVQGFTNVAAAALVGGLAVLSLSAYWAHEAATHGQTLRSWESPYLVLVGLGALVIAISPWDPWMDAFTTVLTGLKVALLVALALLAGPPHLPARVRARPGGLVEFMTQAAVLALLLNALMVLIALRAPVLALPVVILVTLWLLLAVGTEYLAIVVGALIWRPDDDRPPAVSAKDRLTVVIAAFNETRTIARTVHEALSLDAVREVVVVVARRAEPAMHNMVRDIADDHEGVRYVLGEGASKAEDLGTTWRFVNTDLALILDADERVEPATLAYALQIMDERPETGIVQGRKVAIATTWLDRFVAIERRFSTLFDHPMQDHLFGAAHFGGSAALIRREVPAAAGWWSPATLTEDIEFALRVHQDTNWDIAYEPRFLVHEESPRNIAALVRQRSRWARGWSQVARLHFWRLPRSPMPWRSQLGFGWQLVSAVSAPWCVFFPALAALWLWGSPVALPPLIAIILGLFILPSRLITWVVPYFFDPVQPVRPWPHRVVAVAAGAYLWIIVGWLLQLQALYLEVSAAPKVWHATRVRA